MYEIGIFSDPHIGLERRAHTTTESRNKLKQKLAMSAVSAISNMHTVDTKFSANIKMCLGDLFDTYANDEATILSGLYVASKCNLVLGGNHDVSNREDSTGSLNVVEAGLTRSTELVSPIVGESHSVVTSYEYCVVHSIPHNSSQSLFDEAIENVLNEDSEPGKLEIVIMHCNYECGFADNEISLNLTSKQADKLLEKVDYIFIGHEHESRMLKDDRLILVGNIHPTSFSDIGNKYTWYLTREGELTKELVWDESVKYKLSAINSIPVNEEEFTFPTAEFIDMTGVLTIEDYAGVADFMVKVWKANPQALMIRNNLRVVESEELEEVGLTDIDDLPSHISEELKDDKSLLATWNKYLERL